ncbi:class I SAM-dependent methyltransferase [Paraburkholderia sp. BL10I2N1]|uniref:class I SAM-dependent methyltransferase n=1 Tax=Paraburkholderia sp. BL10I2N1 TaxID=1938796 RepID=UPI001060A8DD|nr:class I SAM-dependent methyltransferase [Paraburkholderia sp. BL10I2N1]TDN70528.1 methyltransferase family protein [Paraburkholderia sp. BL10I2N1]
MNIQLPLDQINQRTWNSRDALREFTTEKMWTDPGEASAFDWVTDECRGQPLLDIGIGAGRTIPLMMHISSDYTGIDYTEVLVEKARGRFPGLDLRHMDARDMSKLPSDHFGLTAFSWNGIDCVNYEDREQILKEMYRVTKPGGLVLFSSHNREGPGFQESVWKLLPRFSPNPLRFGWRTLRSMRVLPLASYNYLRHAKFHRDYEGYSIKTAAAHMFGIVIVYTTLPEQRRQLTSIGFEIDAVFGSCDGERIYAETQSSDAWWFHFIARKPAHGA